MTYNFDFQRRERIGIPEAIFCEGKDLASLNTIIEEFSARPDYPLLMTRLSEDQYKNLNDTVVPVLDYDALSATAILHGGLESRPGRVAVVTGGTADISVAKEATRTLDYMGVQNTLIADIGVAGLWRLTEQLESINAHDLVIVVAGMDAALATVLAGLVDKCVIGVPTSIGYGVATGGHTALNSMLASCGQGLVVSNIDNGFGAACAALRILNNSCGVDTDRHK